MNDKSCQKVENIGQKVYYFWSKGIKRLTMQKYMYILYR